MNIKNEISPITKIRPYLPTDVSQALSRLDKSMLDKISEIRLRAGGITGITVDGKNRFLTRSGISGKNSGSVSVTHEEIEEFIYKFCKGSVYSHEDTLKEFYISSDAVRVGLAGECIGPKDCPKGIGKVSSLNIRIPRHIHGCSEDLMKYIEKTDFPDGKGILIISKPGVGKTTLLRDLALHLSSPSLIPFGLEARRVCVIDERREIYMDRIFSESFVDFLSGIGKISGLETAARVLSPEIIICDEIASPIEAEKITRHKNGGIIFIASFHSQSFEDAMSKDYIKAMFTGGVFGAVYTLKRNGSTVSGEICEYTENA